MPRIPKTNIGKKLVHQEEHLKQGSPNREKEIINYGTIIDINYPGINESTADTTQPIEGSDIRVRVAFDTPLPGNQIDPFTNKNLNTVREDWWFKLGDITMDAMCGINGNRDAILRSGARVKVVHPPYEWRGGIAYIDNDNTQKQIYKNYQKNRSNNVVGLFSSLSYNLRPPG